MVDLIAHLLKYGAQIRLETGSGFISNPVSNNIMSITCIFCTTYKKARYHC